jgi:hypothetical protein
MGIWDIFRKPNELTIEFICEDESVAFVRKPVPASSMLPEWYKDVPSFIGNKPEYDKFLNATVKKCMPVFDSMTSGYYILLGADVYVKRNEDGSSSLSWPVDIKLVTGHTIEQASTLNIDKTFEKNILKWWNPWIVKTPKGWSTMFITPMHRDDLPFQLLPGVVDTDEFNLSVQFPFLIKKDFEGIIPEGTPIAQLIPFKRATWRSIFSTQTGQKTYFNLQAHSVHYSNRYKSTSWKRKTYK